MVPDFFQNSRYSWSSNLTWSGARCRGRLSFERQFNSNNDYVIWKLHCHNTWTLSSLNSHWKMDLNDNHIMYCGSVGSKLYNHHHYWIYIEKWFQIITISYIVAVQSPNYIITITIEFTLQTGLDSV